MTLRRRELLAGFGGFLLLHGTALAAAPAVPSLPRRLTLRNAHTGESFDGPYRDKDGPLPDALADLATLLRDHRANKVGPLDVATIDLLADVLAAVGQTSATVLSGFRTPETNAMLAARGLGVAERSQHLYGRAIDITLPARLAEAHRAALTLKRGGVGWYPASHFLHIDTGPVRSWEMGGRGLLQGLFAPGTNGRLRTVKERMRIHRALAARRRVPATRP